MYAYKFGSEYWVEYYNLVKNMCMRIKPILFLFIIISFSTSYAQKVNWTSDGLFYTILKEGSLVKIDPKTNVETVIFQEWDLMPYRDSLPLKVESFEYAKDGKRVLLFTNSAKVWRYNTKGDYWVMDLHTRQLKQLGGRLPKQSLMFAKFSPDSRQVAYVSGNNIYAEDVVTGTIKQLTVDGTRRMINGTFDWVYEEEFGLRDGFRWSPDSRSIAYWQVDATGIRDFYMINNTDSVYSRIIPVEYPKVGQKPSVVRIGVVSLLNSVTRWMQVEGKPDEHYITRMEWSGSNELIIQQLDRKQQESKLMYANTSDGNVRTFWAENDDAWVDLNNADPASLNSTSGNIIWINNGQDFLWVSERDGWRHIYKISRDGKNTLLLTKGNYDIDEILGIDEINSFIYFNASPENALQRYLYRVRFSSPKDQPELVTLGSLKGTHSYSISPGAKMALHTFSNYNTPPITEWISLPDGKPLNNADAIVKHIKIDERIDVTYLKLVTEDNIEVDAWVRKPANFNSSKKYPLVVYVYGEPGLSTVNDEYGNHNNSLYAGDMDEDGYIQASLDCRGTPVLKGAAWRKSIYGRNGQINIDDIAGGAKKLMELPYIDKSRTAIWGWSGGGATTLHIMFKYPQLFTTGISIAAITNLLNYDNIYTERYMGLPEENIDGYKKGSVINYVNGLKGNLLYIHGTGDDNVHYSNAEMLLNEVIKYNKEITFMAYPNRGHSIREGAGTRKHLATLYTNYLRTHCLPGGR